MMDLLDGNKIIKDKLEDALLELKAALMDGDSKGV